MYIHIYIYVCLCTCTYTHIYMYIYMRVCVYIYKYVYINYIYTRIIPIRDVMQERLGFVYDSAASCRSTILFIHALRGGGEGRMRDERGAGYGMHRSLMSAIREIRPSSKQLTQHIRFTGEGGG